MDKISINPNQNEDNNSHQTIKNQPRPILNFQWKDGYLYLGKIPTGFVCRYINQDFSEEDAPKYLEALEQARKSFEDWVTKQVLGE